METTTTTPAKVHSDFPWIYAYAAGPSLSKLSEVETNHQQAHEQNCSSRVIYRNTTGWCSVSDLAGWAKDEMLNIIESHNVFDRLTINGRDEVNRICRERGRVEFASTIDAPLNMRTAEREGVTLEPSETLTTSGYVTETMVARLNFYNAQSKMLRAALNLAQEKNACARWAPLYAQHLTVEWRDSVTPRANHEALTQGVMDLVKEEEVQSTAGLNEHDLWHGIARPVLEECSLDVSLELFDDEVSNLEEWQRELLDDACRDHDAVDEIQSSYDAICHFRSEIDDDDIREMMSDAGWTFSSDGDHCISEY